MSATEREEAELAQAIALSLASSNPVAASAMDDDERQMQEALALSMAQPAVGVAAEGAPTSQPMDIDPAAAYADADVGGPSLSRLVFGENPSGEVMRQWRSQGVSLADVDVSDAPGITPFGAGLAQENGGPCAILAATQAFMLRRLLFDPNPAAPEPEPTWLEEPPQGEAALLPSDVESAEALLCGLADILTACASAPGGPAEPSGAEATSIAACPVVVALPAAADSGTLLSLSREALLQTLVANAARPRGWAATLEALRSRQAGLASPIGALSLLVSALLTRGAQRFSVERDDATQPLLDPQVPPAARRPPPAARRPPRAMRGRRACEWKGLRRWLEGFGGGSRGGGSSLALQRRRACDGAVRWQRGQAACGVR